MSQNVKKELKIMSLAIIFVNSACRQCDCTNRSVSHAVSFSICHCVSDVISVIFHFAAAAAACIMNSVNDASLRTCVLID